jgi:hypothetical protein
MKLKAGSQKSGKLKPAGQRVGGALLPTSPICLEVATTEG